MDHRGAKNYFKAFYIRRFCRIFPLYFLWLALTLLCSWLLLSQNAPKWWAAMFQQEIPKFPKWGYALFLQNFYSAKTGLFGSPWLGPTWSLAVEEQFYVLLPLAVRFFIPRKPTGVLILLVALVPIFRTYLFLCHPGIFVYVLLPCRADALLLGVLCAHLVRDPNCLRQLQSNRSWLYVGFGILFLGMVFLTVSARSEVLSTLNSFEMVTFGFSWIALFYSCLLLIVVTARTSRFAGLMRIRLLRHFGLIAYGVFLIHLAIRDVAFGLILGTSALPIDTFAGAATTFVAFLVTWLLAVVSWNFLEKPIIRWGHSFDYTSGAEAKAEPVPASQVAT